MIVCFWVGLSASQSPLSSNVSILSFSFSKLQIGVADLDLPEGLQGQHSNRKHHIKILNFQMDGVLSFNPFRANSPIVLHHTWDCFLLLFLFSLYGKTFWQLICWFRFQELIGALLGCSLFCLFPVSNRGVKHLPTINFDHLFAYVRFSFLKNLVTLIRHLNLLVWSMVITLCFSFLLLYLWSFQ